MSRILKKAALNASDPEERSSGYIKKELCFTRLGLVDVTRPQVPCVLVQMSCEKIFDLKHSGNEVYYTVLNITSKDHAV